MERDDTHKTNKRLRPALILAAWIVITIIVIILGYPKVSSAIEESGVLPLLKQSAGKETPKLDTRTVSAAFVTVEGEVVLFRFQGKKWGGGNYHDTFEALLGGPNQQVLASGAVSYIHPETELVGLTLRERILFIELTKEYLQSIDLKKATEQLKITAQSFENVADIVLIIDGEMWSEQ